MTWRAVALVLVLTGALPKTAVAHPLVIRTYNNHATSDADLRAARAHADDIFNAAGIEVVWRDCWSGGEASADLPAECRQQPGSNDVMVRLLCSSNQPPKKRYISMGYSLINIPHRPPFLATVFVDLVAVVARNARADFGQLLGRAIAHEIGHLLLNENRHAATGLMRADWSQRDLRDDRASDWKFRDDEVKVIRSAVTERHGLVGDER
jgi:hypothetical protein